jgi:outer membrane lipoprotein-sorting protein
MDILRSGRMRYVMIGMLTVLLGLSASTLRAEEWPTILRDAQTRCERQHALIRDMTLHQSITTASDQGPVQSQQTVYEKGKQSRMEMTMQAGDSTNPPMTITVISNGTQAWMISPYTGKRQMPEADTRQHNAGTDCWDFTPANSSIGGSDLLQGHDCYIVNLNKDSVQHRLWLDKTSLNVLQGISFSGTDSVRWVLSDFRKIIGDYEYPYKVEMFDGDEVINTMLVESVAVNMALSDTLFDPDKVQVGQVDMQKLLEQMFQGQDSTGGDTLAPPQK